MSGLTQFKNPKVTIVTVAFNASDEIETTLKALLVKATLIRKSLL